MRLIQIIVDHITEEVHDAERYATLALQVKAEHPKLADRLIELAEAEMQHMRILHTEAERLIEEARERTGEPPAHMLAIYEYEHAKQIKAAGQARQLIAEYHDEE